MYINPAKCIGCGNCTYVCSMGAISIDPATQRAKVNTEECVECYSCFNGLSREELRPVLARAARKVLRRLRLIFDADPDVCPTSALEPQALAWPRIVRRAFSDPRVPFDSTGVEGRGTEEVKTNDVTGRVETGEVGFTVEFGRPGVGVRFHDIQIMSQALARIGVAFERNNPITFLMSDKASGTIRADILNEKVLSAILELKTGIERTEQVLTAVREVESRLDTVVAIGVGTRCDASGAETAVAPILERLGYKLHRAKTNLGLGRVTNPTAGNTPSGGVS